MLYKSALFNKCYYKGQHKKKESMYDRATQTGKYLNTCKVMAWQSDDKHRLREPCVDGG